MELTIAPVSRRAWQSIHSTFTGTLRDGPTRQIHSGGLPFPNWLFAHGGIPCLCPNRPQAYHLPRNWRRSGSTEGPVTTGGTAAELTTWQGWLGTGELEGYKHLFSSLVTRHVNFLSCHKISSSLSLLGTATLCCTGMPVGSCFAMQACLRRDSKSTQSSKWWRRALRIF